MKPGVILSSSKKLVLLDLNDKSNQLPVANMYVGYSAALKDIVKKKCSKGEVLDQLVIANIACGHVLQKKISINNILLKSASVIDPRL